MASVLQSGRTAVITGAASGVGFAIAKLCQGKGMNLALIDYDATNVLKAKDALSSNSTKVEGYVLDVGDRKAWDDVATQITATFKEIDFLALNAGRMVKPGGEGPLKQWMDCEYWDKTLNTNVFGILHALDVLLPLLLPNSRTPKSIVVTGSKQGITNPPGSNPAYNASKAAVKTLTEHLSHDLRSDPHTAHISVHLLVPGWTWTGLMGNVGPTVEADVAKPDGAWYPSQVAEELATALERGSFYIVCPDGQVDRATDQARMRWAIGDITEDRPALSRWEGKWKGTAEEWIQREARR